MGMLKAPGMVLIIVGAALLTLSQIMIEATGSLPSATVGLMIVGALLLLSGLGVLAHEEKSRKASNRR